MENKRRLHVVFYKISVLCLIIVLVGCAPATPATPTPTDIPTLPPTATDTQLPTEPPPPTDTSTPTPEPSPSICQTFEAPQTQELKNGYFLTQQMIVIGHEGPVNAVINEKAPDAVLLQSCNLSFLSGLSFDTVSPPKLEGKDEVEWFFDIPDTNPDAQREGLTLRLYEFLTPVQIEQRISDVNITGNPLFVFADPVYLTGGMQESGPCYLPTSGGGSGGGKPYGGYGILSSSDPLAPEDQFVRQWAWKRGQGIDLPNKSTYNGSDTQVVIFDTVPMEVSTWSSFPALPYDLVFANIRNVVTGPEPSLEAGDLDGSDHGLFAAGLIHAIAPQSQIHLIRVLNDKGCGTSADLSVALFETINQLGTTSDQKSLHNVIMNLSLGMSKPIQLPDQTDIQWALLNPDFVAFETAIFEAQRLGALIFAAAGNESDQATVLDMVLPAGYDLIYGVAATNDERGRSCFSNKGDIAAPGGDGGSTGPRSSPDCVPSSDNWNDASLRPPCTDMKDCRYGVISLSLRATGGPGYIFWAGTSFATPLVTGLAALTLDKAGGDPIAAQCMIIEGVRVSDRNLGKGIINVAQSLNPALPCP